MIPLFVVDSKDRLMICANSVRGKKLDKLPEKVWNGKKLKRGKRITHEGGEKRYTSLYH